MSEASSADLVIGVDTHKHARAAVAASALGARLNTKIVAVAEERYRELEAWARSLGPVRAFGVDGTGPTAPACNASSAAGDTPSSRSVVPTAICGTSAARATRSTPRAPPVRCWAGKRRPCLTAR